MIGDNNWPTNINKKVFPNLGQNQKMDTVDRE